MLNPIMAFSATRRMRSFKTMLIVIAYVAALLLLAFTVIFPAPQEPEPEETVEETTEEVYYVIKEDGNTLTRIKAF